MDLAAIVTKHIIEAKFEDLSPSAVEATKAVILDQFAAAIAGSAAEGATQVVEEVVDWGGKAESTIWIYGNKVPVANAAFANSVMTHGWDHDDTHLPSITHTGTVTVPAALATAERQGKLSGKELITAVSIGIEVVTRLSAGFPNAFEQGWHPTTLFGAFGAAATAGWVLGLNEEQMLNALGLTYSRASGNIQCVTDGALSKKLQPGFASKAALEAVLLAQRGVTGATNIFEGKYGLYPLYIKSKCKRDWVLSEWGKIFATPYLTFKLYPGCVLLQGFEEAAISLGKENNIHPEEVETITVYCGTNSMRVSGVEEKRIPSNPVHAMFSAYYKMASGIVRRRSTAAEYTEEAIQDPTVLGLCRKTELKLSPEYDTGLFYEKAGRLEIKTNRKGRLFSADIIIPKGHPENPMTWKDFSDKLKAAASVCIKPMPEKNLHELLKMIKELENIDDVSKIIRLVVV